MNPSSAETAVVRASTVVHTSIERAFDVFTAQMLTWWPPDHHILRAELAEMVFEPRVGGDVYDRGVDGSVCRWARVLAYDPPNRVVFSWDITTSWQVETDPSKASEVEVRFVSEATDRTRVEIEHRHLERHGPAWQGMRDAVAGQGGWPLTLARFVERLKSGESALR